jgi:hypothetical protein
MKNLKLLILTPILFILAACTSNTEIDSQRGTLNGNIYTNQALGFSLAIPDSWQILEQDEIEVEDLEDFTDLMAMNEETF